MPNMLLAQPVTAFEQGQNARQTYNRNQFALNQAQQQAQNQQAVNGLVSQAFNAKPDQQNGLLSQVAAIDPGTAFKLQSAFANMNQQQKAAAAQHLDAQAHQIAAIAADPDPQRQQAEWGQWLARTKAQGGDISKYQGMPPKVAITYALKQLEPIKAMLTDAGMGVTPAKPSYTVEKTADGSYVSVNPATGEARPIRYAGAQPGQDGTMPAQSGAPQPPAPGQAHPQVTIQPSQGAPQNADPAVTDASPPATDAATVANQFLAQGNTPEQAMMRLMKTPAWNKQVALKIDPSTGQFVNAAPDAGNAPAQPQQMPQAPGPGDVVHAPQAAGGTYRQMTPEQLKTANLPAGTVAYMGSNGLPHVVYKPSDVGGSNADPLSGLTPGELSLAHKLAHYGIKPTDVGRGKERAKILAAAVEINPNFNLADSEAGYNFMKDLSRSSPTSAGGTVQSAKTVINHLDGLMRAEKGLPTHDVRLLNSIQNEYNDATGNPSYNNWTQAVTYVNQELGKMLKGGVASEGEVKQLEDKLKASASPEQRKDAIGQVAEFMYGKLRAFEDRRDSLLGGQSTHQSFLNQHEQDILKRAIQAAGDPVPDFMPPNSGQTYANGANGQGAPQQPAGHAPQTGGTPAQSQPKTYVNPKTGDRIQWNGTAWVKVQ